MALCLKVELLDPFTVVNFLCINLFVSKNYCLPDGLVCFFKIDVKELVVLHIPERVIYLDFLTELAFDERLVLLALECYSELLGLDVNDYVL